MSGGPKGNFAPLSDRPRISIIIPYFNNVADLPLTLTSLTTQTLPPFEIIVVDDGSTLDVRNTVRGLEGVSVIRQPNAGPSSARNRGLREATGELVYFIDADDLIPPDFLQRLATRLKNNPDAALAYSGWEEITPAGELLARHPPPELPGNPFPHLLAQNRFAIHCALVRHEAVHAAGGFDPQLRQHEDWDLWLKIAAQGAPFVSEPGLFATYRQVSNSNSSDREKMQFTKIVVMNRAARSAGMKDLTPQQRQDFLQELNEQLNLYWRSGAQQKTSNWRWCRRSLRRIVAEPALGRALFRVTVSKLKRMVVGCA